MQNIKNNILFLGLLLLSSCQYFTTAEEKTPLAKVYDAYLYLEDVNPKIYKGKSATDSLLALQKYIEKWSYRQLLLKQAEKNVDTATINRLARQYKEELLIDSYKNLWVQDKLDTLIPADTLQAYYLKNKSYFRATFPLVNCNYLVVDKNNPKINKYKKWFFASKPEYKDSLFVNSGNFKQFDISGNKWFKIPELKQKFKVFEKYNERQILKKSKKFVLTDSLSLYLVFVKNSIQIDDELPLEFIENDLKKLILNKRKQTAMLHLQQELKQEALKHKHFKIIKNKQEDE